MRLTAHACIHHFTLSRINVYWSAFFRLSIASNIIRVLLAFKLYTLHSTLPPSVMLSRFPSREIPIYKQKIAPAVIFIWSCQKNVVYLHRNSTPGMSARHRLGWQTYLKGVYWRSVLTSWNLANFRNIQDLATIDVLRDIDYPSCACLVHCLRIHMRAHAYLNLKIAREYIYIRRGLRVVSSNISGNARASWRGTTTVGLHAFYLCLYLTNNPHSWEFLCKTSQLNE